MERNDHFHESLSAEGRYRILIEGITDYAIYMLDPNGLVTSWNPGAERFKGYNEAEILGQHFSKFYTEEDKAIGLPETALRVARESGHFEREGWRVRKDGTRFWAHVIIDPIRDPNGNLIGYAKITRDLSERRRAEEQLRHSQDQFRLLVQGVTDYALYMLDLDGHVSSWNAGAERIKGYSRDEILGHHFSRFYTEDEREAGVPSKGLQQAATAGRWETEGWRVRKDGSRFWAHVVIDAIRNDDGNLIGFAKITRDVTERKNVERQLEEAREALFQSQKMEAVGQLTGGIAHDFNNLLTVIIGGLDTIARSNPTDVRIRRALKMSRHAADRAAGLTSHLLAFSRKQALEPTPSNLNTMVRDMADLLHRTLGEQIEVESVLSPRLWAVEIDQNQFESAILNLAVNARDAMPSGGKLTIETQNTFLDESYTATDAEVRPGQYVMISISDTGSGMSKSTLAHVFEPFFTTKEMGRGTGLGLSMVYGFVKQSGGHVTIYSEEGRGTTVKLYFPRHLSSGAMPDDKIDEPEFPSASKNEVVLIVEDNDDVRTFGVTVLSELGYQVLQAADAETALSILRSDRRIDLLFTDVVLPGQTGRALAEESTVARPKLKVLFTTGYSRNAIVHHGRLDRGVRLLQKPYTFAQLASRVREVLDEPPE